MARTVRAPSSELRRPEAKKRFTVSRIRPTEGNPYARLTLVKGALYGTTLYGGPASCGTVFRVTVNGAERVLYSFKGPTDGCNPYAALIYVRGELYGTTQVDGAHSMGTVFKITTSGKLKVLYAFKGGFRDGANPKAGLTDVKGTLFGTTSHGGPHGEGPGNHLCREPVRYREGAPQFYRRSRRIGWNGNRVQDHALSAGIRASTRRSKTSLNSHRATEPPMMSLDITCAVFVHSIRLGSRLAVNERSGCASTFKVSIDIVHLNVHTAAYTW